MILDHSITIQVEDQVLTLEGIEMPTDPLKLRIGADGSEEGTEQAFAFSVESADDTRGMTRGNMNEDSGAYNMNIN